MNQAIKRALLATTTLQIMLVARPHLSQATDRDAAAAGGLEEAVLTATRREERVQDVPISVGAFS